RQVIPAPSLHFQALSKTALFKKRRIPWRGVNHVDCRSPVKTGGDNTGFLHARHVERPTQHIAVVVTHEVRGGLQEQGGGFTIVLAFEEAEVSDAFAVQTVMPSPHMGHDSPHSLSVTPHHKRLANAVQKKGILPVQ